MRVKKPCLDIKNEIPTSKPILETLRNHVLTIDIDSCAHKGLRIGFRIGNRARRTPNAPPPPAARRGAGAPEPRPASAPHAPVKALTRCYVRPRWTNQNLTRGPIWSCH